MAKKMKNDPVPALVLSEKGSGKKSDLDSVTSTGAKRLRDWQEEAFAKLKDERFGLTVAFCGSGKSMLQVALATYDVAKSKHKQKQLIVVPQSHISQGFVGDVTEQKITLALPPYGEGDEYTWQIHPSHNFCHDSSNDVINGLVRWLLTSGSKLSKNYRGSVISGLNAVASHQAIALAWAKITQSETSEEPIAGLEDLGVASRDAAIKNLTFRPDEAHHIRGVYGDDDPEMTDEDLQEANNLGKICKHIFNSNKKLGAKLHLTTATPFRGDRDIILSEAVRKAFTTYSLDWLRHWETLEIEEFLMHFHEYKTNPIDLVVEKILAEPKQKHMVFVPPLNQKWRHTEDSYKPIIQKLQKANPKLRILDLVDKATQDENKKLLLAEPKVRDGKDESKFDVVVACRIGREGTDWCPCSRLHNTALGGSPTDEVQTQGRVFRKYKGKNNVIVRYYIKEFVSPKKRGVTKEDLLTDRVHATLVLMLMHDRFHPIMIPPLPQKDKTDKKSRKKGDGSNSPMTSLSEVLGQHYSSVVKQVAEEIGIMHSPTAEDFALIEENIIHAWKDKIPALEENREEIRGAIQILAARARSRRFRELNIDVSFLRENPYYINTIKWDDEQNSFFGKHTIKEMEKIQSICNDWMDAFLQVQSDPPVEMVEV